MAFLTTISSNGNGEDPADLELVASYRHSKDLNILARLYQRYLDLLYGVCLKYLEDKELAKDAVMEIFEELAGKLLRHDIANFRGWLYTLARNHCLMQLRSANRLKARPFDPDGMQTMEESHLNDRMEKEVRLDRLSECIETLSADQRTVVSLFYLENKCYKEIETITGHDWNKVRSLIQNGKRNLRLCMQRHEAGSDHVIMAKSK
ncbi:MAG TPA: sigma-70 family RNA polymerase sigma factor [Puia sp.]|nr:sigma-70 family RNA polymerase sigma factor [Puia sp.]